jgi:site-specific DNA recombinase
MRAVIYSRFSSQLQDARSIEDQERRCRAFASTRDLEVVDVYSVAAISGTTTAGPALQRLLRDARSKHFKAVVVDDLYRLSRNRVDSGNIVRDLDDLGVKVVDVETGASSDEESSDVVFAVKGIVGAEWVKGISRSTHRGLEGRALGGFATGGKTYGYTSKEELNPADPEHARRVPVIAQREAEVVRRVFQEFARGQSPREIAIGFNADGVPAPHDHGRGNKGAGGWAHTTIRAMLRNRRYLGELTWNATRWKKKADGKRRRIPRPQSERVTKHVPELAIVGPELWAKVAAKIGTRAAAGTRQPRTSSTFALSGLLRCGACGGSFGVAGQAKRDGKRYRTLGCGAHKDHRCSNGRTISERKVLAALMSYLRDHLSKADRVEKFLAAFQARWRELEAEDSPAKRLAAAIAKQRQQVENVTQPLVTLPGSKAPAERLATEETKLADLDQQLRAASGSRPKILPHPSAIARYVRELATTLEGDDPAAAGRVLRRALAPLRMEPQGTGYKMTGALDVCSEVVAGACYARWKPRNHFGL